MTTADSVHVTFKVTRDGEVGHPMDHILTTIPVGPDGQADDDAIAEVVERLRREVRRTAGFPPVDEVDPWGTALKAMDL
jgi:hypothetical protein